MAKGPVQYTKEVIKEGKRVRWPKRDVLVPMIITVIIICAFFAIVLSLEDYAAGSLINQLKSLFEQMVPSNSSSSSSTDAAVRLVGFLF